MAKAPPGPPTLSGLRLPTSPLVVAPIAAVPGGVNRSIPQFEIQDTEAWAIFDAMLGAPGIVRRRGPITAQTTVASARAKGLAIVQDLDGNYYLTMLCQNSVTNNGFFVNSVGTTFYSGWPQLQHDPSSVFDSKDAMTNGVFIGSADGYDTSSNRALGYWLGCTKPDTGTMALLNPIVRGDTSVSLSASGSLCGPGMWIFNVGGQLVGAVKSITGNTLFLHDPALVAENTQVTGTSIRGVNPRVSKGAITCATSSTQVNGGATRFQAQGLRTGTWDLFTTDYAYIGTVQSVASDTQLTLVGNAAVALTSADYIAIRRDGSYSITRDAVGFLNCSFGGHQFFAQGNKLRFSGVFDSETLDLTSDGDNLEFSADPIRSIHATLNAVVALTENDAFALTGAIGTTPDRWRGQPISDDGTICGMACVTYQGGVIWPGKRGIWFWNGSTPTNIGANLGDAYRTFVVNATRAWGTVIHDTYFLFIEDGVSGIFSKTKGATTSNMSRLCIAIDLTSGAIGFHTNLELRGGVQLPSSISAGSSMYCVTSNAPSAVLAVGDALFTTTGNDPITCQGNLLGAGPDLYVETKKYDAGDPQRLKLFKMLLLHYLANGGNVMIDTVTGIGTAGTTATAQYLDSAGAWADARVKFMKRSQFCSFRLYQSTISGLPPGTAANVTDMRFGPWGIGYTLKRPGRV